MAEVKTSTKPDFRDAAAQESLAVLAEVEARLGRRLEDPMDACVSYCVALDVEDGPVRSRVRLVTVLGLVIGFSGILIGGMMALRASKTGAGGDTLGIAAAFSFTGMAVMVLAICYTSRVIKNHIRPRMKSTGVLMTGTPIPVRIEDAETIAVLKSVADDLGYAYAHELMGVVQIEGLRHRYAVWAQDLVRFQAVRAGHDEHLFLDYRIGAKVLRLVLKSDSAADVFKRQAFGGSSRLEEALRRCLKVKDGV